MFFPDYQESEGITHVLIHTWMEKHGWVKEIRNSDTLYPVEYYVYKEHEVYSWRDINELLQSLAKTHKIPMQQLLADINPRMRDGWPSGEAISAHQKQGGNWIGEVKKEGFGLITTISSFSYEGTGFGSIGKWDKGLSVRFWPVDKNYNKVPWPADENKKHL